MNTTPPSRKPTRPNWGRRALLILVPALLAGAWYAWPQVFGKRDPLTGYQFSTVQRGDIEDVVTATGTLQPRDYVDVGAQVSGQLRKIHVEVGDTVNAGDTLLIIKAMKVMNPIKASKGGTITQILVETGKPVEYGDVLMVIE